VSLIIVESTVVAYAGRKRLADWKRGQLQRMAEVFVREHDELRETDGAVVPRQVVGRISSISKLGMVGSARPMCTSIGRFQAIASCGRTSLYSIR